ncbi:hypothetical protein [Shewanella seohaensis]|uniref:Uncharacterized protein n=1 Tax=Shewanella seohaensis TaxID=755175 RepID=A0ABV4VXB2_9GAMM
MRIKISDDLLTQKEKLIQIIYFVSSLHDKHSICTDNVGKIFDTLGRDSFESTYLMELISKQANGIDFVNSVEITLNEDGFGKIKFDSFGHVLSKNAIVILENKINDSRFIQFILKSKGYRNIAESYGTLWSIESNGGCGQIPELIEEQLKCGICRTRILVIHDSDKLYPQAVLSKAHSNIIQKCKENHIKCHTLKKREMENYIVDDLLFNIIHKDHDYHQAWSRLTNYQKSHYDYKYGFASKKYDNAEYGGLFAHLSAEDQKCLNDGFGKDIANLAFLDANLHFFYGDNLKNWCHNADIEFKSICSQIESIL